MPSTHSFTSKQVTPPSELVYPVRHGQVKLPSVFVQFPRIASQLLMPSTHLFTSEQFRPPLVLFVPCEALSCEASHSVHTVSVNGIAVVNAKHTLIHIRASHAPVRALEPSQAVCAHEAPICVGAREVALRQGLVLAGE
eukprot:2061418-Rhodomonas_salina.1